MVDVTILKCKDCNSVIVIPNKELRKLARCPHCESGNLVNIDEEFDETEM